MRLIWRVHFLHHSQRTLLAMLQSRDVLNFYFFCFFEGVPKDLGDRFNLLYSRAIIEILPYCRNLTIPYCTV